MSEISLPDLSVQWAESGDILKPSDSKIQQGWQVEVPPRQWFNWLDHRQDQAIAHIAQHGISSWSPDLKYQANKSYVQGSDGVIYKAITTNSNINPVGGAEGHWQNAFLTVDQVATAAQSRAMTANNVFLSPLQLANAFTGTNSNPDQNGFQQLPGGLILQWGLTPQASSTTADVPFTFPRAFTSVFQIILVPGTSSSAPLVATHGNLTNTGFTYSIWNGSSRTANNAARYLVLGV